MWCDADPASPGAWNRLRSSPQARRCARTTVPRTSSIFSIVSPAARRCAISDDRAFGIAVQQHVGFGIDQYRAAHFLRPVIEMRDPPQARFDAADDDGHVVVRFARALAYTITLRSGRLPALPPGVYASSLLTRRSAVYRFTIESMLPAVMPKNSFGRPSLGTRRRLPIRLRDDAYTKSLCFEQPSDDRHAETRVIDVCITRDDDDVARIPAQRVHLFLRGRKKRCGTEAMRPILAVREQRFCGLHDRHSKPAYDCRMSIRTSCRSVLKPRQAITPNSAETMNRYGPRPGIAGRTAPPLQPR